MKYITYYLTAALLLIAHNSISQNRNWTIARAKDEKATVRYDLVKKDEGTHFYYIAETTATTTLDKLDAYFSNTENHKQFLERTPVTKELKKLSDNEWMAYYYFNAPWPMSDSDLVLKITRVRKEGSLQFIATAARSDYKTKDVERMNTYKVIYDFKELANGSIKITYNADYIPIGSIPKFLIKSWFPEGPAQIVTNLGATKQH